MIRGRETKTWTRHPCHFRRANRRFGAGYWRIKRTISRLALRVGNIYRRSASITSEGGRCRKYVGRNGRRRRSSEDRHVARIRRDRSFHQRPEEKPSLFRPSSRAPAQVQTSVATPKTENRQGAFLPALNSLKAIVNRHYAGRRRRFRRRV